MRTKASEITFKQPEPQKPRPVVESVTIPFLKAVASGALVVATLMFGVNKWRGVWLDFPTAGLTWALVSLVVWALSTWRDLFWWLEKATKKDLDSDGYVGDPAGGYVLVNAAPPSEQKEQSVDRAHKRLCQFVQDADQSTATRDLVDKGYSRDEIKMFRELLLRGKWAEWRNPISNREGWRLARPVGVILAAIE